MIERDFILFFGLPGLLSRSCNTKMDARFSGYEFHLSLDYSIFIAYNGDRPDRYISRFNEMIEPRRIIYAIPYVMLKSRKNALRSVQNLCSSRMFITELSTIELLIQLPFILPPINEFTLSIESSKGIYTIFIHSFPIIPSNIVSNDYLVINQPNKFRRYINIGDPIAVLGPIDSASGSVDLLMHLVQIHGSRRGMESHLVPFLSLFLIDYSFTPFIPLIRCIINGMIIYQLKALYI